MDKEDTVYIYTVNITQSLKKNEILLLATTWMGIEGIILSEVNSDKDKYHMISYVESKKINKQNRYRFINTKNKLLVAIWGGWEDR